MITCTRCGEKNADDSRFCGRCGHKLQSSLEPTPGSDLADRPPDPLAHLETPRTGSAVKRLIEAWSYVLLLTGTALVCAWHDLWWPLYPVAAFVALVAWLRKI